MTARMTLTDCRSTSASIPIQIKNCGTFRVYYLRPVSDCPGGYCFGKKVKSITLLHGNSEHRSTYTEIV